VTGNTAFKGKRQKNSNFWSVSFSPLGCWGSVVDDARSVVNPMWVSHVVDYA